MFNCVDVLGIRSTLPGHVHFLHNQISWLSTQHIGQLFLRLFAAASLSSSLSSWWHTSLKPLIYHVSINAPSQVATCRRQILSKGRNPKPFVSPNSSWILAPLTSTRKPLRVNYTYSHLPSNSSVTNGSPLTTAPGTQLLGHLRMQLGQSLLSRNVVVTLGIPTGL